MSSMGVIGEMRAAPRGGFSGWLADILGGAKGWLNKAQVPQGVPLVGGMGAGDLAMGQAPELLDSMSYGFSPVRGAGMAATLDPAVLDLLGLMAPAAGRAGAVARGMPGVVSQAAMDAYGPAVNMARPLYTLGGKEIDKATLYERLRPDLAPAASPVELAKALRRERKNSLARMRYQERLDTAAVQRHQNLEDMADRRYGFGDQVLSSEEMLRAILERGKSLPQTPQGPVPMPFVSYGSTLKY